MKSQPCADKLAHGCAHRLEPQNRTVEEFQETPADSNSYETVGINPVAAEKEGTPTLRTGWLGKPDPEGALVTRANNVEVSLRPNGSESAPVATRRAQTSGNEKYSQFKLKFLKKTFGRVDN